ncbi:MAG: YciI family protein [Gammaproteobacteria bacterium]
MQYVIISKFDADKTATLQRDLPADAFAAIDRATQEGKVLNLGELTGLGVSAELAQVLVDHLGHLTRLRASGGLISGGPCEGFRHAINVFEAESEQQAIELHDADPLAQYGFFSVDQVYGWNQVF